MSGPKPDGLPLADAPTGEQPSGIAAAAANASRLRIKPAKVILTVIAAAVVAVLWFIFTAVSIGVTTDPQAAQPAAKWRNPRISLLRKDGTTEHFRIGIHRAEFDEDKWMAILPNALLDKKDWTMADLWDKIKDEVGLFKDYPEAKKGINSKVPI